MAWYWWALIVVFAVAFAIDWVIVLGTNPRRWKGGNRG